MKLQKSLKLPKNSFRNWHARRNLRHEGAVARVGRKASQIDKSFGSNRLFLRRVVGESMLPALKHNQVVVCWKTSRAQVDDVVIVLHDGIEKIKRLIDTRNHHIFLVGDNAKSSTDSRHFGWLTPDVITGRVIWPKTNLKHKPESAEHNKHKPHAKN